MNQGFRLGYNPALDGMRGVCVLAVILHHSATPFGSGAFMGVDGFFVLSGFLITSLLLEEWSVNKAISLSRFYARRALRLLPALLLLLAVCALYTRFLAPESSRQENMRGILSALLYVGNWTRWSYTGHEVIGLGFTRAHLVSSYRRALLPAMAPYTYHHSQDEFEF